MSRVGFIIGDNGTGKTTLALSGATVANPANHFEFDVGSLDRAAAGLGLSEGSIVSRSYYAPLTNILEQGRISVGNSGISPATVHVLAGWKEQFWQFVQDFLASLSNPGYPVLDTETKMWLMTRQGFLQEVQEAAGPERERLNTLQYTEPNARHSQLIEAARMKNRDLLMIAHEKEEYRGDKPTGKMIPDGFKEVASMSDYVLRLVIRDRHPVAIFLKAGAGGLELLDREIEEPTLEKVNAVLDAAEKLRRLKMGLPGSNDELLELAAAL